MFSKCMGSFLMLVKFIISCNMLQEVSSINYSKNKKNFQRKEWRDILDRWPKHLNTFTNVMSFIETSSLKIFLSVRVIS